MKRKNKKIKLSSALKEVANKIYSLELECQEGKNVQENMTKIEEIMSSLSLTEGMQIDEYLTTKFFDK